MSERPITQDDLIAALEEIELITGTGDGLDPDTTARVHMLAGIGRAVEDAAAWFVWPAPALTADVQALQDRIRELEAALITVCQHETAIHYRHDAQMEMLEVLRRAMQDRIRELEVALRAIEIAPRHAKLADHDLSEWMANVARAALRADTEGGA